MLPIDNDATIGRREFPLCVGRKWIICTIAVIPPAIEDVRPRPAIGVHESTGCTRFCFRVPNNTEFEATDPKTISHQDQILIGVPRIPNKTEFEVTDPKIVSRQDQILIGVLIDAAV
jgi:hypothetical protein